MHRDKLASRGRMWLYMGILREWEMETQNIFLKAVLWKSVKLFEDCFYDITWINYKHRVINASVSREGSIEYL